MSDKPRKFEIPHHTSSTEYCDLYAAYLSVLKERDELKRKLDIAVDGLNLCTINDENKSRLHLVEKEYMELLIKHMASCAQSALEKIKPDGGRSE